MLFVTNFSNCDAILLLILVTCFFGIIFRIMSH